MTPVLEDSGRQAKGEGQRRMNTWSHMKKGAMVDCSLRTQKKPMGDPAINSVGLIGSIIFFFLWVGRLNLTADSEDNQLWKREGKEKIRTFAQQIMQSSFPFSYYTYYLLTTLRKTSGEGWILARSTSSHYLAYVWRTRYETREFKNNGIVCLSKASVQSSRVRTLVLVGQIICM